MNNTTTANEYRDQMLAMCDHIKNTPEIWAAATNAAMNQFMASLANDKVDMWLSFEFIVEDVVKAIPDEDAQRIAPVWNDAYELVSCAFEEMLDSFKW